MTELRFHRELYSGTAVDTAVKTYGPFARFELAEEPQYWIVRVSGDAPTRERKIAGELANTALGLSVSGRNVKDGA